LCRLACCRFRDAKLQPLRCFLRWCSLLSTFPGPWRSGPMSVRDAPSSRGTRAPPVGFVRCRGSRVARGVAFGFTRSRARRLDARGRQSRAFSRAEPTLRWTGDSLAERARAARFGDRGARFAGMDRGGLRFAGMSGKLSGAVCGGTPPRLVSAGGRTAMERLSARGGPAVMNPRLRRSARRGHLRSAGGGSHGRRGAGVRG